MPKTIGEMRKEFYEKRRRGDFDLKNGLLGTDKIADYWLSVISQRDCELREKIEKLFQDEHPLNVITGEPVETYGYEATHNGALKQVLHLIHTHNKE